MAPAAAATPHPTAAWISAGWIFGSLGTAPGIAKGGGEIRVLNQDLRLSPFVYLLSVFFLLFTFFLTIKFTKNVLGLDYGLIWVYIKNYTKWTTSSSYYGIGTIY